MRDLDTATIEDWVHVSLIGEKGLSPSMAIKCYWNLSSLCEYAKTRGALDINPCKGVKLPDLNRMPAKFIEDEAHTQIRRTLPEEFQDVLDLLDETGLRPGELQGLHVENVDLKARTLDVAWSFDASPGQMKELKDKECRTVPIADKACKILARRINAYGWGQPAPVPYKKRSREVESGLVLAQPNGRPYSDSEFRKSLRASARIAYVGKGKARHNVGRVYPYLWRHRYAKRLLPAGVPIDEMAVLMACVDRHHEKWYGHLGQSGWDSVRVILNAGLGAGRQITPPARLLVTQKWRERCAPGPARRSIPTGRIYGCRSAVSEKLNCPVQRFRSSEAICGAGGARTRDQWIMSPRL